MSNSRENPGNSEQEIKPCPYRLFDEEHLTICASKTMEHGLVETRLYWVECSSCGARGPRRMDPTIAIGFWNSVAKSGECTFRPDIERRNVFEVEVTADEVEKGVLETTNGLGSAVGTEPESVKHAFNEQVYENALYIVDVSKEMLAHMMGLTPWSLYLRVVGTLGWSSEELKLLSKILQVPWEQLLITHEQSEK